VFKTHPGDKKAKVDIIVAKYIHDFENVVGGPRKQSIPLFNIGLVPTSINVFVQEQKENDVTVKATLEKTKLQPLEGTCLNVILQVVKKKNKPPVGRKCLPVFIEVKGGPRYEIDFLANITTPELSFSHEVVNFGEVPLGQRKTITMRFENNKEVDIDWSYTFKEDVAASGGKEKKDSIPIFQLSPSSGILPKGKKANVDIIFTPNAKKDFELKVTPTVKNAQGKPTSFKLVGKGINYSMKLDKTQITLGPLLPYVDKGPNPPNMDPKQYIPLKLINETNSAIEVYSVEFDRNYIKEERMIESYRKFNTQKYVALPVKQPGTEFWKEIVDDFERVNQAKTRAAKIAEIDQKLAAQGLEESVISQLKKEKDELEQQKLLDEANDMTQPEKIPKVDDDKKVNIIVYGWDKVANIKLSQAIAEFTEKYRRGIVDISKILQYNVQKNLPAGINAEKFLADKAKELTILKEDLEKKKKKLKKGEPEPIINEADFKVLPKEMFIELLKNRLLDDDCNAGAIFNSLETEFCKGPIECLELISEACGVQNVRVIMLEVPKIQPQIEPEIKVPDEKAAPEPIKEEKKVEAKKEDKKSEAKKEDKKSEGKKEEKKVEAKKEDKKSDVKKDAKKEDKKVEAKTESKTEENKEELPENTEEKEEKEKPAISLKILDENEKKAYIEDYTKLEQKMAELTVKALASQKETPKKYGERMSIPIDTFNQNELLEDIRKYVHEPQYPDPATLPLPPPRSEQLLTKPKEIIEPAIPISQFKILTAKKPIPQPTSPVPPECPASPSPNDASPEKESPEKKIETEPLIEYEEKTRWVLPAKDSVEVLIKFYSERTGEFIQDLNFGIVGGDKKVTLSLKGNCEYPMLSDKPKTIFVAYERRATKPPVFGEKRFDKQRNVFDFGPLLIGKEFDKRQQEKCKVNVAKFMFSNAGNFPLHVDFVLRSQSEEYTVENKTPFYIEPAFLDLPCPSEEPYEVKVWAFPDKPIEYKDTLMCIIKDNPKPVVLNMTCWGSQPEAKIDPENIIFEKLLVQQQATKELKITNESRIPITWKLTGIEKLPKVFAVNPKDGSGILKPFGETVVQFTFSATEQKEYEYDFVLNVNDDETKELTQQPKNIKFKAKSYIISVAPRFEGDKQELNFGAVRVNEKIERKFFLKNSGLYDVNYRILLKTKEYRDRFTINEMQGVIAPNEEKPINVAFKSKTGWSQNVTNETTGLVVQIMEMAAGKEREEIPIKLNVKAVYSQFSIAPARGINFGPMQYGESKTMQFEIKNEGKFDFNYIIYDPKNEEVANSVKEMRSKEIQEISKTDDEQPKKAEKKEKKEEKKGGKGKGKQELEGGLKVGQFVISPSTGDVAAGSSVIVKVQFEAEGAKFYESNVAIDISGRNYNESPNGSPYQFVGESCIPGINIEDMQSIFEEQRVVSTLDPNNNAQAFLSKSVFSIEENVFWFGTIVPSKDNKGQIEKFKVTNPNKIPCTVKFSVKPRTSSKSEGFAFKIAPEMLKIPPHESQYVKVSFEPTNIMSYGGIFEALVENGDPKSKSGKLHFELRGEGVLPSVMMEFPKFIGDDGLPMLSFKKTRIGNTAKESIVLKNEGSVPATVQFDPIVSEIFSLVSNNSATIAPKSYQNFEILFEPKTVAENKHVISFITVNNPYEAQKVKLYAESYQEEVVFENLPNNSEDEIKIGDCVIEKPYKIQFSISSKTDKTLRFEWLNYKKELKIYPRVGFLKPHAQKNCIFVFKAKSPVKIQSEPIYCRFSEIQSEKPNMEIPDWDDQVMETRMVRPSELKMLIQKRAEEEQKMLEENESLTTQISAQKFAQNITKSKAAPDKTKKEAKKDLKKDDKPTEPLKINESEKPTEEIQEPTKEPPVKIVENSNKEVGLKCIATADYPKYECSTDKIVFKPTLMYQTRSYKFSLKNKSLIAFEYTAKITDTETGTVDSGPYNIIPRKGVIQAGCEEAFIIKFSPTEAEDSCERLLVLSIPNLDPSLKPLVIELDGSSERPICHFELPPSKYREKKEKDMAPIDNKYNIIEFESLGTKVKNIKRFMVVNPTSQGYDFEWEQNEEKNTGNTKILFKCLTPKGTILSGKKFEMAFEYVPESIGTHESYWEFRIPSEKVMQPFLVVGQVIEPLVLFETAKVDFGPLLVGGKNREIVQLRNQEHIPFSFAFDPRTLKAGEDSDSLQVSPVRGIVDPQSAVPIEITFFPRNEKSYNYNLVCKVKRKGRPLNINVKGVGYSLKHEVYLENGKFPIQTKENVIEFGDFFINEKKSTSISIVNLGEFNFDFVWKRPANRYFTITPETGSVKKGSKITVDLTYFPLTPHKLGKYKCALTIVSGPTYEFTMVGSARKPGVEFNFLKYDFGKCFVMKQPLSRTKILEMKNIETTALSLDLKYEKKPHLDVQLNPGQVLLPYTEENKEKISVPIIFTPRDFIKYEETVTFDFNGIYKAQVLITGEGIPLVLELTRPEDQFVDFGVVKVGGDQTRSIVLINKSKKGATFKIFPDTEEEFEKSCLNMSIGSQAERTLKPGESLPIEIRFAPTLRMPAFKHDIMLQIKDNETRKLCTVTGVSHGIEVKFIEDTVDFGSVVKGSRLTKLVQLSNFGDIGTKFTWDSKIIPKQFTIIPEMGHIAAHEEMNFEIIYHPDIITEETMRYEKNTCKIDGADSLHLTFVGKCVDQAKDNTKKLNFSTIVRTPQSQNITISNPTTSSWIIKPTISTKVDSCKEYFKGKAVLEIPAKGTGNYEVTYLPLTMTKEKPNEDPNKTEILYHEASLFFPLPDGSALLYILCGQSTPPKALDNIKEKAIAKKQKFISIPIKNWLNEIQRFNVSWKLDDNTDPAIFIRGANTFDVGASSVKEYKLNFLAYKEGTTKFTLTFKNDASGEYCFFEVNIEVAAPDPLGNIELISVVRESVTKIITIENPLSTAVTIDRNQFTIDSDFVFITPETLTISPQREGAIELNFRPLIIEEKEAVLTLENPDLGTFTYNLMLKGLKSTIQRSMHFKASLGAELIQAFRFTHFVKANTTYTVKIEKISETGAQGGAATDFRSEQNTIPAPVADSMTGIDLSVNVVFTPNNIGESRAILIITNPDGIEYTCLLYGHGTAPQPQPITKIQHGKTAPINFKNPFVEKCEFTIRFDNPCFSLANKLPGPIDAGKSIDLQVKFEFNEKQSSTGRMMISTKELPPWIYYLHGEK